MEEQTREDTLGPERTIEGNEGPSNVNNNQQRRRNPRDNNRVQVSKLVTYEGETAGVNAILCLRYEKFHKKVSFKQFTENVYNYILSNVDSGGDMKLFFKDLKDPFEALKRKHMPREEQGATEIKKTIQRERIKQYI